MYSSMSSVARRSERSPFLPHHIDVCDKISRGTDDDVLEFHPCGTSSCMGRGVSIRILPGWYGGTASWPSANTARRDRWSAGIRRICPSQWCLRVRTAVIRSYEGLVSSSRYDLPVMPCSCRELKPLSFASALGISIHASLPCVRVEQTLAA